MGLDMPDTDSSQLADENRKTGPLAISIIIPCFNGSRYISRLVSSLRPTLDSTIEVIFVDDGSTDGSLEQFQRHMPEAVLIKQQNAGVGATRNRAIAIARGEFLQLLDVDDTIEAGKLPSQLDFARKHSFDVVYSDWRMVIVDGKSEQSEAWMHAKTEVEIVEALLGGWWFPPSAALVRKEAFASIGGCDPTLGNTCDDFDLWIRLAIAGFRYGYLPGRFANYYRYTQVPSVSRKDPLEFFAGEARIIRKALALLSAQHDATKLRCAAAARRLHGVARNLFLKDRSSYETLMKEIHELDPNFRPDGTLIYRLISRLLGFENAEYLAGLKRTLISRRER
jgi:glycosyltransferase involved in cell wall biosynthesis